MHEATSGDQLAIAKETGRRLGMGVNMYPSSSLLGKDKDETISSLPIEELIEAADGFAGVFPGTVRRIFYTHTCVHANHRHLLQNSLLQTPP